MSEPPAVVWPELPYATVRWRAATIKADSPDEDLSPDWAPLVGKSVRLTPHIDGKPFGMVAYDRLGPDPMTIWVEKVDAIFNSNGHLTLDGSEHPVRILATDHDMLSTTGWYWIAEFEGFKVSFSAPAGSEINLTPYMSAPLEVESKLWVEKLLEVSEDLTDIEAALPTTIERVVEENPDLFRGLPAYVSGMTPPTDTSVLWLDESTPSLPESGSPFELRGYGMPNGVVSAPTGTYYTDNVGTNGAWRWLKTSGTGNTGWTVIVGDTGWRNVTEWFDPAVWGTGTTFSIPLLWKMTQRGIKMYWNVKNISGSTQNVYVPVDLAMVPGSANTPQMFQYGWGAVNATAPTPQWVLAEYNFYAKHQGRPSFMAGSAPSNSVAKGEVSYEPIPTYVWPTTLPGTAV